MHHNLCVLHAEDCIIRFIAFTQTALTVDCVIVNVDVLKSSVRYNILSNSDCCYTILLHMLKVVHLELTVMASLNWRNCHSMY